MATKKSNAPVLAVVNIQIEAGQASPAGAVGTALGPHGIGLMDFCKAYNAQTESQKGQIIPAIVTVYEDRSFDFILKTPPTSFLIKKALGLSKGAQTTGKEQVGTITESQLAEIAEVKMPDLNTTDIEMAKRQIAGTARSMGVLVEG